MRIRPALIAALLLCCICLSACGSSAEDPSEKHTGRYYAMDTVMDFTVYGGKGEEAVSDAEKLISNLEARYSVTQEESEIYRINIEGKGELKSDTLELLEQCLALSSETGGAFRIDIYELTSLWGFTTGEYRVPSQEELEDVLSRLNAEETVVLKGSEISLKGVLLDLGAAVKGYTSQQVIELWRKQGVTSALLSLGGNVQTLGLKPDGSQWKIGIRDPENASEYFGVLSVDDCAVVTSGGYQRYFEEDGVRYSHIMDAETGYPAQSGLSSVTIIADDGLLADCLSTALYVMGPDEAVEFWRSREDFEAVLVTDDGSILVTEGIAGSFSCDKTWEIISR